MGWLAFAVVSAVAAALTTVLAKVGLQGVPSNLATAIRTGFVLTLSWALVLARGETVGMRNLRTRTVVFLALSAVATAVSWLAYYRALQLAPAARVSAVDKLSLPLTMLLAWIFLREPVTGRVAAGVAMIALGAVTCVW